MRGTQAGAIQILRDAVNLINRGWTQNTLAVDNQGRPVNYNSSHAVAWCAVAAIRRAGDGESRTATTLALAAVKGVVRGPWISAWNNVPGRTVGAVVRVLEQAAGNLEATP